LRAIGRLRISEIQVSKSQKEKDGTQEPKFVIPNFEDQFFNVEFVFVWVFKIL
jgi:hypothetical protein